MEKCSVYGLNVKKATIGELECSLEFLLAYLDRLYTYLNCEEKEENILMLKNSISRAHNKLIDVKQELYARNAIILQKKFV